MSAAGRWRIGKLYRFEATRTLGNGRADGHSFTAEAVLSADALDEVGFVVDFGRLSPLKSHIDTTLDHRFLNDQIEDASDEGIGAHLSRWARENLPRDIVTKLDRVQVRTGRPSFPHSSGAVVFGATHWLDGLPADHPCGRRHGHSYSVTAYAKPNGAETPLPACLHRHINEELEGVVLNAALPFNPTSERLSAFLAEWAVQHSAGDAEAVSAIRVSETESSWARFDVEGA